MALRDRIEKIIYAGLKPEAGRHPPLRERVRLWLDRRLDRLAGAGEAPEDPLYLTNLTWTQKARWAILIAAPVVVTVLLVAGVSTNLVNFEFLHKAESAPAPSVAKALPDLVRDLKNLSELEIVELALQRKEFPPVVEGAVRNNSDQVFRAAEISFNVTDERGAMVGSVSTQVQNVPPHGTVRFRVEVPMKNAALAIIRETHRLDVTAP